MKKRSKHTLSHYRMHTAQMGELFPVGCVPVIPGDTIQHNTSALVRVSPLNTPVMHPVNIRIHHFFVPNRIVWPESENGGWEGFITGGPDGNNTAAPPQIVTNTDEKSVLAYLGMPHPNVGQNVIALPVRAFGLIYNEWYRDQDLVAERDWESLTIPRCAWEKDYFSTSRPWTQKGPEVSLPIGTSAPVISNEISPEWARTSDSQPLGSTFHDTSGGDDLGLRVSSPDSNEDVEVKFFGAQTGLTADLSSAEGVTINEFREAFAIQRYQEARARYGSRFTEYLRYLGIRPSDARLQRPEFLGGGSARLNFSEVLQTTPSETGAGVGDLYGHGIAGAKSNRYRKFFEEHGYIISVMSVRPKATYLTATHRDFFKLNKEEFFQRELQFLGQQEVLTRELYTKMVGDWDGEVFGYQDRYDEYRSHPSFVGQDFTDTLSSWHLARDFTDNPVLNQSFIDCDPSDRIYQVTEGDHLWIMLNHHMVARRLLIKKARPRIL